LDFLGITLGKAVRDDELAARGLGENVRLIKVQVFAIACAMVAVAGALYASYVGYIDPTAASLDESMLCMVIVGGVGAYRWSFWRYQKSYVLPIFLMRWQPISVFWHTVCYWY
jgi:branched-chain amino acid transport system permease protein